MPHLLLEKWQQDPHFLTLSETSPQPGARLVSGLEGSQRTFFLTALYNYSPAASLLLTPDAARAERYYEELKSLLPEEQVCFSPA